MTDSHAVDKRTIRRSFERAAATYDSAAVLQNEICRRMLARLEYIKLDPATILDAGCGTGNAVAGLLARYPRARLIALDIAFEMVRRAGARRPWWRKLLGRRLDGVCGDMERMPLAAARLDLVWSNLALQWSNEPQRTCSELARVLKPGGLLMFSSFGPDTLKELRAAYQGADRHTHVHRFIDMHDVGDLLVQCGFTDPVMDVETVTMTYADVRELMRDLKAIGARNATLGRPAALSGKSLLAKVTQHYETFRREGRLPATFEVVYGHAWKPQARVSPTGRPVIEIMSR